MWCRAVTECVLQVPQISVNFLLQIASDIKKNTLKHLPVRKSEKNNYITQILIYIFVSLMHRLDV